MDHLYSTSVLAPQRCCSLPRASRREDHSCSISRFPRSLLRISSTRPDSVAEHGARDASTPLHRSRRQASHSSTVSQRFRSVERMKEPFRLYLSKPHLPTPPPENCWSEDETSPSFALSKGFPSEAYSAHKTLDTSISAYPIESLPKESPTLASEISAPDLLADMNIFGVSDREVSDSTFYSTSGRWTPARSSKCTCSPRGAPCEMCIISDYQSPYAPHHPSFPASLRGDWIDMNSTPARSERTRHTFSDEEGITEHSRLAVSPFFVNRNKNASKRYAIHRRESEAAWLAGSWKDASWLDEQSLDDIEFAPVPTSGRKSRLARRRQEQLSQEVDPDGLKVVDGVIEYATAIDPAKPKVVHVRRSFSSSRSSRSTVSSDQDCSRTLVEPETPECQPESHFSHVLSTPPETPEHSYGSSDILSSPSSKPLLSSSSSSSSSPPKPSLATVSRPLFLTPPHSPEKRLPIPAAIHTALIATVPCVISLLETSISNFPCTMLQPDSTTIDLVRDAAAALHAVPTGLRHPGNKNNPRRQLKTDLAPFQRIFPITSDFLRGTLYANIVALNYVTDLAGENKMKMHMTDLAGHRQRQQHAGAISIKAAQTLGLASVADKHVSGVRLSRLERSLNVCVGRLMEAMCGKGRRDGDAILVASVREVVRQLEDASFNATLAYLKFLRL